MAVDPERGLIRTFFAYAAAAVVAIIIMYAITARIAFERYMMRKAEARAIDIGETVLSPEIERYIHTDRQHPLESSDSLVKSLETRVLRTLSIVGVIKIKVYDTDRRIVYSNDRNIIGVVDDTNEMLNRALSGEVVSELETKDSVWDLAGEKHFDLDLVETYLPLHDSNGKPAGVGELYMDVAEYQVEATHLLISSILVVVTVLAAVFATFTLLLLRAQRLIRAKATEIRVLQGLLPICAHCKSIRDEVGAWHRLENYIARHSESTFTHSICPTCRAREYGDLGRSETS